jgi:hypothetical protein
MLRPLPVLERSLSLRACSNERARMPSSAMHRNWEGMQMNVVAHDVTVDKTDVACNGRRAAGTVAVPGTSQRNNVTGSCPREASCYSSRYMFFAANAMSAIAICPPQHAVKFRSHRVRIRNNSRSLVPRTRQRPATAEAPPAGEGSFTTGELVNAFGLKSIILSEDWGQR